MKTLLVAACLVALASPALAGPLTATYDLTADTGDDGGTLSGQITWTWDGSTISSNADLTLANADSWSFAYTPGEPSAFTLSDTAGDTVVTDSPVLVGTFGLTDLMPGDEHTWLVGTGGPSGVVVLKEQASGTDTDFYWQILTPLGNADGAAPGLGEPSPWKLTLTSPPPVPEPTSLALFGLGAAGLAVYRRRKRTPA